MNKLLLAAVSLLGLGLVGCVDLKPKSDPARVFLLVPGPQELAPQEAGPPGPSVGLKVTLPDYLLNGSIAVGKGENELVYSDLHRWAEPLDRGVRRVLGRNLGRLLATDRVLLEMWSRGAVDYEVSLDIDTFLPSTSGDVRLVARWSVRPPSAQAAVLTRATSLAKSGPAPADAMDETVALMSGLLGELSEQIAESVGRAGEAAGSR